MKLLILGGSGLVGSRFLEMAGNYEIVAPPHGDLDLLDLRRLKFSVQESGADVVLNFAAYTNVDEAEKEKDKPEGLVYKLNVLVPEILAQVCSLSNKYFIHISTDYIFDGSKQAPYIEEDQPNPLNWYGKTKFLGEEAVKKISKNLLIIRTEMPYSSHFEKRSDLARTFLKMLKERKVINGVSDQFITPTFVDTAVNGLIKLIDVRTLGIYNLASTDFTTPYDFAVMIADKFELDKKLVRRVSFEDYNKTRLAKRPQNSYLDVSKFEKEFGKGILKSVSESLDEFKKMIEAVN